MMGYAEERDLSMTTTSAILPSQIHSSNKTGKMVAPKGDSDEIDEVEMLLDKIEIEIEMNQKHQENKTIKNYESKQNMDELKEIEYQTFYEKKKTLLKNLRINFSELKGK